jgi:hypothetical protein
MGRGDWGPSSSPHTTLPRALNPRAGAGPRQTSSKQAPSALPFAPNSPTPRKEEVKRGKEGDSPLYRGKKRHLTGPHTLTFLT